MNSELHSRIDYQNLLVQVGQDLPTIPTVLEELSAMLKDGNSSTQSVREMMVSDPSMTMKILRVANNVHYRGARSRVTDVEEAIGTLGFDKIHMVILTTAVFEAFSFSGKDLKFEPSDLWQHSLGTAVASSAIAEITGLSDPQRAYTSGLIHDIGKVARLRLDPDSFCQDVGDALYDEIPLHQVEEKKGSPLHHRLGHLVCHKWGLNQDVESVVHWHHEPDVEKRDGIASNDLHQLIDVVSLGNWTAHAMHFGFSGHRSHGKAPEALVGRMGLKEDDLSEIKTRTREAFKEFRAFLAVLKRISNAT
jgi:putative nucleotidyltransferase with HDIG domain